METRPAGQLFDIGYQRYDGPRQGRTRARMALFVNGVRQSTGIGRGARSKILPILMLLVSIVPAAIILVISAITGELAGDNRPVTIGDYFPINSLLLMIVAAILAPSLIIPDRTENVLSLYLVRPLGILDYLVGRWLAFFLVTSFTIFLGPLLLLTGYILLSSDAAQAFRDSWMDYPKILLGAIAMGAFITSLPFAVAAFTPRRVYAAAVVIGGVLVLGVVFGILTEGIGQETLERSITEEELAAAELLLDAQEGSSFGAPDDVGIFFTVTLDSGEIKSYLMTRQELRARRWTAMGPCGNK